MALTTDNEQHTTRAGFPRDRQSRRPQALHLRLDAETLGIMGAVGSRVRRVLVYRLGSLGDMLVAVPSLRLIRSTFPEAQVLLLTNMPVSQKAPAAAAVFDGSGLVDGYLAYPLGMRQVRKIVRFWWTLFRWQPDALIYLAAARGTATARRDLRFFRLCGVRQCIGVPLTPALQGNCYGLEPDSAAGRSLAAEGRLEPEAARLARNLAVLGDARLSERGSWDLALTQDEEGTAKAALGPELLRHPLIAVSLGTKVQAKDWGNANWYVLLNALARRFPQYALLLAGASEERLDSESAAQGWREAGGGPVINLCGRLTPRQSAAAFRYAQLFIGHDSGPMHLAAAVGTTCVAIFAARNVPCQWFPFGQGHRVLYHRVDCMGCGLETCIEQQKKCLLSISVGEVLREVEAALAESGAENLRHKGAMMEAQPDALSVQNV